MKLLALTEAIQLALIAALVTVVPSILALATLVINLIAASHVKRVRRDLIRDNKRRKLEAAQNRRDRAKLAASVAEVHEETKAVMKATNGMKDELVREVRQASFAAGAKSETDKADHVPATITAPVVSVAPASAEAIGSAIAAAIDKNVETVKKDVKVVKSDVKAVKDEILKAEQE